MCHLLHFGPVHSLMLLDSELSEPISVCTKGDAVYCENYFL